MLLASMYTKKGDTMTIETALETALVYEKKVRDVYLEAARKSADETGTRIFTFLAEEEAGHVSYLEYKLKKWNDSNSLSSSDLNTAIKKAFASSKEERKLRNVLSEDTRRDELALLEKARELELETSGFYKRMVAELPPDGQAFFNRFLEIERGHLNLVQYEIDSLTKSGFWMGFQEFDMEAID